MSKALIAWGGWEGHEPEKCAAIVKDMLEGENFSVRVEQGSQAFASQSLENLDLIVPIITQSEIEPGHLKNLTQAIQAGVGLAGFHGGMGDSFRNSVDYQFMTGGQWVAHPGDIIDYDIHIIDRHDPIMQGVSDFSHRSEQYYMHVDPSNEVLAETTFSGDHASWIDGVKMPVVWKRKHGKGRVFYSALGHVASEFLVPEMKTIFHRGMLWAGRNNSPHN